MINISRKDVVWSYLAQFFGLASGIITLPLILMLLSANEIGMNYLMITIGSLVSLFDFGFSPQFGRNIAYVYSGAQELKKEGIEITEGRSDINYRLLATLIHTARYVYRRIALIVLFTMLSLGSIYIYRATNGFTNVHNSFIIWVLYSFSTFLNIYYSYYTSLLFGKGFIMQSKKALVYSKIVNILLTFIFLFFEFGLFGVTLANFISPFINRWFSYRYFFTDELNSHIKKYHIKKSEIINLFNVIWYNARKVGLVFVGAYAITKLNLFVAGLFLPLSDVASFGLMMQFVGLLSTISSTIFITYQPTFASLRIQNNNKQLIQLFSYSMCIYYFLFIFGSLALLGFGSYVLILIRSNATLPSNGIILLYLLIIFLETNHSNFSTLITTKNNIPFVGSALISGALICIGSIWVIKYTDLGILGLIVIQGLTQLGYSNWKWPYVVLKEFELNLFEFLTLGKNEVIKKIQF